MAKLSRTHATTVAGSMKWPVHDFQQHILSATVYTNEYSKVNCTLNRVFLIYSVLSLYPLSSGCNKNTLFKVRFTLLYLFIFIDIIVQHATTKIVSNSSTGENRLQVKTSIYNTFKLR